MLTILLGAALALLGVPQDPPTRIAFVGLHGGEFAHYAELGPQHAVECTYLTDAVLELPPDAPDHVDLTRYDALLVQHLHDPIPRILADGIRAARAGGSPLRVFVLSGAPERIPGLEGTGFVVADPVLQACYAAPRTENQARILKRVRALCTGGDPDVGEPDPLDIGPLHHPEHDGPFADVAALIAFAQARGVDVGHAPRVAVVAHATHYVAQQPRVIAAIVAALERRGAFVFVAIDDLGAEYRARMLELRPDAAIHTCHSRDDVELRVALDVPHLHSAFFRGPSIDAWRTSPLGLAPSEVVFHCATQELLGGIEPFACAGTLVGGGSDEDFTPIPDRVERLVDRTLAHVALQRTPNADKRIAIVYYDREASRASLFRGSATGMFLNAPQSVLAVLRAMQAAGYRVDVPRDEDDLIARAERTGRVVGIGGPGEATALAATGAVPIVPADVYARWFEERVPPAARDAIVRQWGPPPGRINVVEHDGTTGIVIPRIDLGNVVLMPQPLRGEAYDPSQTHDKVTPPPHSYLAAYFWMELGFGAHARVHFGTHGSEFLLPGKAVGLADTDWTDIVIGKLPNVVPWVMNNVGESPPARRRSYGILIDHLVPPTTEAGLADGLAALHDDLDRFARMDTGALREKLRGAITARFRSEQLAADADVELADGAELDDAQIDVLTDYLHAVAEELTPTTLHVLGEPPPDVTRLPWLVHCGGEQLVTELAKLFPAEGASVHERTEIRALAEQVLRRHLRDDLALGDAIRAAGGALDGAPSDVLTQCVAELAGIDRGLAATGDEITNLLRALDGRFIAPGPGNSPDRNPSAVPTGRDMFLLNPREIPTREAWDIGVELADGLLARHRDAHGGWPTKIAFDLSAGNTWRDFGVMEAEILWLLGCEPVRDAKGQVIDVAVVPRERLGRPRIDVFVRAGNRYDDMLGDRLRLIDRAARLAGAENEADNAVRRATDAHRTALRDAGLDGARADLLAAARIFGPAPGSSTTTAFAYLVERSGDWTSRDELVDAYVARIRCAFTDGAWGEEAPEAFRGAIADTQYVMRNWSDATRGPTTNRYQWLHGGALALAIETLTGNKPEYLMADLRDLKRPSLTTAEAALRRDFRARALNRKWLEGMMKEGYAGADQLAVVTTNAYGWQTMRAGAVPDELFEKLVDVYVRDTLELGLREFFERENPWARQEIAETLLEVARKGMWNAAPATLRELAQVVDEVRRVHGDAGGLTSAGNAALDAFVTALLGTADARAADADVRDAATPADADSTPARASALEPVTGVELTPQESTSELMTSRGVLAVFAIALLCVALGFLSRRGGFA